MFYIQQVVPLTDLKLLMIYYDVAQTSMCMFMHIGKATRRYDAGNC